VNKAPTDIEMSVRVIIADDHRIVREGLLSLLEKEPNMEVVGQANNGRATVELARELKPEVIVMDITMPQLNGIEATRQILADVPSVRVIALSMHRDKRFVAGVLAAGATGYLLKDCALEELVQAIRVVTANQTYLSPDIAGIVVQGYMSHLPEAEHSMLFILTAREREVLQLLAEGKTAKEIASALTVSVKTVETHRHRAMNKLDIHTVAELTKYAVREGLTSVEG
jgi:DNA-binding NarL/FixJ family response regulator